MKYIIQLPANNKSGWRKLRDSAEFITREAAEAYARKYWGNRFRIVEIQVNED